MKRLGVYPGSFNPPTTAHLAIARRAIHVHDLERLDIVLSRTALGKETVDHPTFDDRQSVVEASFADVDHASVKVTEQQLLSEICQGYQLAVVGGDKWQQIQELKWYKNAEDRRRQLALLPPLTIVKRGADVPDELQLDIDESLVLDISSTTARSGLLEMMTPEAARFATTTGAWIEPYRYDKWKATAP